MPRSEDGTARDPGKRGDLAAHPWRRVVADASVDRLDADLGVDASASFEGFYEREHERLFGALYVVTGDRQEAEELMQEAFLRVWQRWDRVQAMDSPTGYLYRVGMNAFRMRYRHSLVVAKRRLTGDQGPDPFEEVEVREDVRRVLASLPAGRRAALVLTDLLGLTAEEAGRVMGLRASTVRGAAAKARASIRTTLEER